jgi:hypothetical protein
MDAVLNDYQKQMLKEYERQREIRNKNIAFINARFFNLKTAYETIFRMIPGVIIYNLSFFVFTSANGRMTDEFFFDVMYPFQDVHFTVSYKKGRFDTFKVVPFLKMHDMKCQLRTQTGDGIKFYFLVDELMGEPVNLMKSEWGFEI